MDAKCSEDDDFLFPELTPSQVGLGTHNLNSVRRSDPHGRTFWSYGNDCLQNQPRLAIAEHEPTETHVGQGPMRRTYRARRFGSSNAAADRMIQITQATNVRLLPELCNEDGGNEPMTMDDLQVSIVGIGRTAIYIYAD